MATGIKIYNDSGTIQIDESYFNLVLIDKHTNTISTPVTTAYDYAVAGDVAAIAVKVWPETFTVTAATFSGGVWTYRLSFFNNPDTTGTCTFTVYAFGKAPTPTETVGLAVYDPSGGVIFHSQFKPLRIQSVVSGTSNYTGTAGRDLAVMVVQMPAYSYVVGSVIVLDTYSPRVAGNTIQVVQTSIGLIPGAPGLVRDGAYAAIDVTNY